MINFLVSTHEFPYSGFALRKNALMWIVFNRDFPIGHMLLVLIFLIRDFKLNFARNPKSLMPNSSPHSLKWVLTSFPLKH